MSLAAAHSDRAGASLGATRSLVRQPLFVVLLAFAASVTMSWPHLLDVWTWGGFYDTDDAMRMVQVRDWLNGQGWFDLVQHRLHPPAGLLMHWSRVVDVPVGALVRLFEPFAGPATAETLARIVFPLGLQLALITVTVHLGRLLAGEQAALPTAVLVVASGFMFEQFPAGRIDHHAPQITLLVAMTAAVLTALSPARARHAALGGLCIAVSLAISLENLPFIAVIVTVPPLAWLVAPETARRPLLWFALGLAVATPVLFAATVPPARYLSAACDAFSIAHVTGVMAGAAGLAALAVLTPRLPSWQSRVVAVGALGILVGALMLATYPECLRSPYAAMDPRLVDLWLAHVTEAQPLLRATRATPDTFTMLFCPLLAGAAASLVAVLRSTGLARGRWLAILAMTLVGLLGTFWEIRVAASAQPIALMGGAWAVAELLAAAQRRGAPWLAVLAAALLLPLSTLGWALVPAGASTPDRAGALANSEACRTPASLAPLARIAPGLIFAPIDDGSHLLAHTPHSVVAAPYHRNQAGNLAVLSGFMAVPEAAEALVRGSEARYVAFCPGETQMTVMTRAAPEGLAARLQAGDVPGWLRPVPLDGTPYRLFELR